MAKNDKYIEMHGTCVKETEKAILFELKGGKEIWVPKSQIEIGTKWPSEKTTGPFSVAEWIVKKNNWLGEEEIPF